MNIKPQQCQKEYPGNGWILAPAKKTWARCLSRLTWDHRVRRVKKASELAWIYLHCSYVFCRSTSELQMSSYINTGSIAFPEMQNYLNTHKFVIQLFKQWGLKKHWIAKNKKLTCQEETKCPDVSKSTHLALLLFPCQVFRMSKLDS